MKRFTSPPFRKENRPEALAAAIPRADPICSASRSSKRPAVTAPASTPITEVGWNPRQRILGWQMAARRQATSYPATMAVSTSAPDFPLSRRDQQRHRHHDRTGVDHSGTKAVVQLQPVRGSPEI